MNDSVDAQGNKVKVGVAYMYVFAMPGPNITCVIAESINADGTVNAYDLLFKMGVQSITPDKLWRPLKNTWSAWPEYSKAAIEYAGQQSLDLTEGEGHES
jgi:hypothetical protein